MKFIHLSDLHMGKRVNEFSMLEDQKYILGQILSIVKAEQPDGVILAGDVYDKAVPPAEAVQVFDSFLTGLAALHTAVFVVSGNHDSAERLAFGAGLMSGSRVYVTPVYDGRITTVAMEDAWGEVQVHLLPFLKPALVRHAFPGESAETSEEAVKTALSHLDIDTDKRNVLAAHQFVTGASLSESEELAVGGLDQISASVFADFDYVALGHIHGPQWVGRETVRYCGTPLKYSFSEAGQEKSVTVAELGPKGEVLVRTIPLKPLRDMRKLRGTYLEVTAKSFYEGTNREDYVQITLTDEEDIPDGMQKLRVIYPNLMRLEYDNRRTRQGQQIQAAEAVEEKSGLQLFEEFYELQNNGPMSGEQREFAGKLIDRVLEGEGR
ncbi:MAG: exonuclease SbcCD subunit D [Eubacteriales bacterium]|nr:exonuclease SbcCD subunit D [Eubacteriales bacterium]